MAVTREACPNCGAPVQIPTGSSRVQCAYCKATLAIERQNGEVALAVAGQIAGSIEKTSAQTQVAIQTGTDVTQTELRRMQLAQDLSMAQMRLSNVQSELRSLERMPPSRVTRRHMEELDAQEEALWQQVTTLQNILNPPAPADATTGNYATKTQSRRSGNLGWRFFGFRGRIGRAGYWGGMLVIFILFSIIAPAIPLSTQSGAAAPQASGSASPVFVIGMFLLTWISLAVSIKRFHDRDKAGWWVLIAFIPFVGVLWLFIELGFFPGTPGANRYG